MIAAYADPPYIGQARKHYDMPEVDHAELIERMTREYDSWALSCSSTTLQEILAMCPPDVRIGAWVKPFASFKKNVNPAYAWEPVILWHGRNKGTRPGLDTTRDWVAVSITLKKGLTGAKPPAFCFWLFEFMGLSPADVLVDLFPGTGIVTRCWNTWCSPKASIVDLPLFEAAP
jgi:hypothetical protein